MSFVPPDFDTGTIDEWFAYFRLTSFLPAMPVRLRETLDEATDAACAHRIMTGYVAAATDVIVMFNADKAIDNEFLSVLRSLFELHPADLLHLNAHDIARLATIDATGACEGLRRIGFSVSGQGHITAYAPPPAPPAPKPPAAGPKTA